MNSDMYETVEISHLFCFGSVRSSFAILYFLTSGHVMEQHAQFLSILHSQSKLLGHFTVFSPSQCWGTRLGELSAINNIRRTGRDGPEAFGVSVRTISVWECSNIVFFLQELSLCSFIYLAFYLNRIIRQVSAQNALQRRSCRWNQITILKPTGAECFDCQECPAGQGLVPQCGSRITADVSVECVHCQKGEGYSDKHDISSCKPCTICDPNEETISPCTATKNAKCGKCNSGWVVIFW